MKLYSLQPSPYGSRVRLALRRKEISFEIALPSEVNPQQSSFLAPSPMEVPTLVADDGTAVSGSSAIFEYLEDAHPAPSLLPKDPANRARARKLVQTADTYIQDSPRRLFGMAVFAGTNDIVERVGGAPPTDVATFVEEHRVAFAIKGTRSGL